MSRKSINVVSKEMKKIFSKLYQSTLKFVKISIKNNSEKKNNHYNEFVLIFN